MADSSDYELGAMMMQKALEIRSASGGLKSLSVLKAGLLKKGYLSITGGAM
jgi:hypothetical protein